MLKVYSDAYKSFVQGLFIMHRQGADGELVKI